MHLRGILSLVPCYCCLPFRQCFSNFVTSGPGVSRASRLWASQDLNLIGGLKSRCCKNAERCCAKWTPLASHTSLLAQDKRHNVIVNVSPIDVGHVLFVPEPESCLPQVSHLKIVRDFCLARCCFYSQVFTEDSIRVCLELVALSGHRYALPVEKPDRNVMWPESKPHCGSNEMLCFPVVSVWCLTVYWPMRQWTISTTTFCISTIQHWPGGWWVNQSLLTVIPDLPTFRLWWPHCSGIKLFGTVFRLIKPLANINDKPFYSGYWTTV